MTEGWDEGRKGERRKEEGEEGFWKELIPFLHPPFLPKTIKPC